MLNITERILENDPCFSSAISGNFYTNMMANQMSMNYEYDIDNYTVVGPLTFIRSS